MTPDTPDPAVDTFVALRPRLFGIAYRMLGVVADAEDVVQEAFLRWTQAADGSGVAVPRSDDGWLVSVTTRLAIDRLRRTATERAAYEGQWLPEPVAAEPPERRGAPPLDYAFAWLNGEPAVLSVLAGKLLFATVLHLDGERITGLYRVMNPAKLAALGRPLVLGPGETLRDLL